MTEERKDWCLRLADSMERCSDPTLPCDGCIYEHTCLKIVQSEEENREITRDGVK